MMLLANTRRRGTQRCDKKGKLTSKQPQAASLGAVHLAQVVPVSGIAGMVDTTVVPKNDVVLPPYVGVDEMWLLEVRPQPLQQRLALFGIGEASEELFGLD
jgi:hypothetical protein